jgi:hypothetical protein
MEVARLALDYVNAFLTPAPLAAGIVLFILLKYRTAIGNVLQLLAQQSEHRRKVEGAMQVGYASTQFLRVGALYDKLLDHKIITPEQYRPWATFAAHFKRAYREIVKLWEDSIGGGPAIGDQTRSETLALTRAVVELEGVAYRHLAKAASPPPRQIPPHAAEAVAQALERPDP